MVKLQKPIPKKLGNKPKLDNPIKKKKQQIKKEKSASTVKNLKPKLLESPVKEAKAVKKPLKEVQKKGEDVPKSKVALKAAEKGETKPSVPLVPQKLKEEPKGKKKSKKAELKGAVVRHEVVAPVKAAAPLKIAVKGSAPVKDVKATKAAVASTRIAAKSAPVKAGPPLKTVPPVKAAPPVKAVPAPVKAAPPAPVKDAVPAKSASLKKVVAALPVAKTPTLSQKLTPTPTTQLPTKGPVAPSKPQKGKKKKNKKVVPQAADPTTSAEKPKVAKKTAQLQEKKIAKIAFRMAKQSTKVKKQKKERSAANTFRYDPIPYDEEKFNTIVNVENIKKIAEALKTQVEKEVATKKSSIFDDYRYFLQVGSFKIANCPKRMVKLNLKHSLVDKDDDVLLIVPDLQRGAKADYEPTIHHYEDMLRFHGVEGIKVMPMNQLRKEFGTFEQKRRLCASYEHYLCDGRIVSHVVGIVGKIAQKPRNTFHAVRLHEEKDIKTEIEKSMRKTAYRQLAKSSLHAIPVGTHKFTSQQLAENIQHIVEQLKKVFPGGLGNVRNLYLRIDITGTTALPLYVSMAQAPELTPIVMGPREQRMMKMKREANEVLSKFAMTKEGKLIKLTKPEAEKKRKLQEMKAALKEDEEVPAKKAKKAKKTAGDEEKAEEAKVEEEVPAKKAQKAKKVAIDKEKAVEAKVDEEVPTKKAKKAKKADANEGKKEQLKELELPEDDDDDDVDSSDEDEDNVVQLGGSSDDDDDEEDNDDMGQVEQEEDDEESLDAESDTEILENGLVEEGDEESEEEDQQEVDGSDNDGDEDDDDDDDEGDNNDDDDDEEDDESD